MSQPTSPATGGDRADDGRWVNRGDSIIYASNWVTLATADVLLPDGSQVDHHVVRLPGPAAGTIMVRDGLVLLMYRHRFITDTWGWEIPAGRVDDGETPAEAAIRESAEETGWQPGSVQEICTFNPANGILDQVFHIFLSCDATQIGPPTDPNESSRLEWVGVDDVRRLVLSGGVPDGLSFGALTYAFTAHLL
jgi:8-oxo-dGTP pyrophosphatase MutT (NUDIX family)